MGIETFPEIENFQKLPHRVIVKGGSSTFTEGYGAELRGIVINNTGQSICDLRVCVVIFNENKLPIFSTRTSAEPESLSTGNIASFLFEFKELTHEIHDYYLYTKWRFDERE